MNGLEPDSFRKIKNFPLNTTIQIRIQEKMALFVYTTVRFSCLSEGGGTEQPYKLYM